MPRKRQRRDGADLYDAVLDVMPTDPGGILAFRLPRPLQRRLSGLAARNGEGRLTDAEQRELGRLIALETTVRTMKAKALNAGGPGR